jgi:hypothetical protein
MTLNLFGSDFGTSPNGEVLKWDRDGYGNGPAIR